MKDKSEQKNSPVKPEMESASLRHAELEASVQARARQSRFAFLTCTTMGLVIVWIFSADVSATVLASWFVPIVLLVSLRLVIAKLWTTAQTERGVFGLQRADLLFRLNSMATQAMVGSGIWIISPHGDATTPYIMSLMIALFGLGVVLSLVSDFRSALYSLPLLLGPAIAYWILPVGNELVVAVALFVIFLMLLAYTRETRTLYLESITARYEKQGLLASLDEERMNAIEANRQKSQFMATTSHDLRQPLTAAQHYREAVTSMELPARAQKLLASQGIALDLLQGQFDNLMALNKLESKAPVELTKISLANFEERLFASYSAIADDYNVELRLHIPAVSVITHISSFERILGNLIDNSIKHAGGGSVDLVGQVQGKELVIELIDRGKGLPNELAELINSQSNTEFLLNQAGLGLTIVAKLSAVLNINLSVKSQPGSGTHYTILVQLAENDGLNIHDRNTKGLSGQSDLDTNIALWIVDDERLVADSIAENLSSSVLSCRCFNSGTKALERLSTGEEPDFILIDDMLSEGERGLVIAHELNMSIESHRIALMSGTSDQLRLDDLESSSFRLFRKPLSKYELLEWLSDRRLHQIKLESSVK